MSFIDKLSAIFITTCCFSSALYAETPPTPLRGLEVYDVNHKFIGNLDGGAVLMQFGTLILRLAPRKNGFAHNSPDGFLFESTNCTGTKYLPARPAMPNSLYNGAGDFIAPPGNSVYFAKTYNGTMRLIKSIQYPPNDLRLPTACTMVNNGSGYSKSVVPAVKLVDLNNYFTPPFHIEPVQ